ncbi:MAG: acyl-CoA thioesterase [bacterium]|nr:acyl-CoA thioesterase [bacterium]
MNNPQPDHTDSATRIVEVVFPSLVNHYGTLFGGIALQWMDRAAWVCSTRFTRKEMVTIASDKIVFKKPVPQGNLVELIAKIGRVGRTSVTVEVELYSENPLSGIRELATKGDFVMVAVDRNGKPAPIKD